MATDQLPALFQSKVPAHLKTASAAINAEAAAGISMGAAINRISLKQSRFRLVVKGEEKKVLKDDHMDLIIVRASSAVHKAYYEKAYTAGQDAEAPDCYSEDGVRPAADAKNKQCDNCAGCPMNQFGSKISAAGKKTKACADSKRIAVTPPDMPDGELWQLSIPAMSMRDFASYVQMLNQISPPVPYNAVVTRISFDTEAEYPKLNFEPVDYLPQGTYDTVAARYDADDTKLVCSNGNPDAAPASSEVRAKQEAAKPAPAPEPEQEEVDESDGAGWGAAAKAEAKPKAGRGRPAKKAPTPSIFDQEPETPAETPAGLDDVFGKGWE